MDFYFENWNSCQKLNLLFWKKEHIFKDFNDIFVLVLKFVQHIQFFWEKSRKWINQPRFLIVDGFRIYRIR